MNRLRNYHLLPPKTGSKFLLTAALALIAGAASFATLPFEMETIDPQPAERPWYKMAGDIDGDGLPDIVIGGSKGPLTGYLNPTWEKVQLGDRGWDGVGGQIGDIDGDGDLDIAMGGVIWFENPGHANSVWTNHQIDEEKIHDIRLADINNDGLTDLVGRNQSAFKGDGNKIFVYLQQPGNKWSKETFDCPHGEGLKAADLDQDGDTDITLGNLWFENTLNSEKRWKKHSYTTQWTEPDCKVEVADINGDQRLDIILTPAELKDEYSIIAWYEAPKDATRPQWKEHILADSIESVIHSLGVGDLDLDGDIDITYAEMHQGQDPDEVVILLNEEKGKSWSKQILSENGSHDIVVVDIDNDGDLDIFGTNHSGTAPLELWRNGLIRANEHAK